VRRTRASTVSGPPHGHPAETEAIGDCIEQPFAHEGANPMPAIAIARCCPIATSCSSMMQVAPSAERPEALAYIALEFFERRDLFLVGRESGLAFP